MSDNKIARCSFCGNHKDAVKKLIVGDDVAICSDCIELCTTLMQEELQSEPKEVPADIEKYDPVAIKEYLDQHVIGQNAAKTILSVAIANHYKRITFPPKDLEIAKGNV
mgnify:FL=1